MNPRNLAALPPFLQKQLKLGYELSDQVQTVAAVRQAIDQCLNRDADWIRAYDSFIKDSSAERDDTDLNLLSDIACGEADYALHMWNRDFADAAQALAGTLEKAFDVSHSTGAWHSLWLGAAYELAGDSDTANEMYRKAHAVQRNIPAIIPVEDSNGANRNLRSGVGDRAADSGEQGRPDHTTEEYGRLAESSRRDRVHRSNRRGAPSTRRTSGA